MINVEKLKLILAGYKTYFPLHWKDEKYKWEAIKHFQDHWDIDVENFGDMFRQATDKTFNLLASGYAYPRGMITNFAKADGEATRAMFRELFDESKALAARVDAFQTRSEELRAKYDDGTWRNHYQNTNAISTYLWLRYPDKYYIYKYELFRAAAKELEADYMPKRNGSVESLIGGNQMYDEICEVIKADPDIRGMLQNAMVSTCYPDPELKTATIDVGFYLARYYLEERKSEQEEWFPKDYSPELSVDDWVELLNDSSIFTISSLQIMKRLKDYGGAATCKQLSVKYGETPNFYNGGSWSLAQRIAKKTGCPVMTRDTDDSKWWPVLYVGKKADKTSDGAYIWKLRDELNEALEKIDLSGIDLYVDNSPALWKIGHGFISESNRIVFQVRRIVVVRNTTKSKAAAKLSQDENFMDSMKKGDYFYLCYGNSIRLLGQFVTDKAILNPEMKHGWYEREYRMIKESKDISPYKGIQKWWTPNDDLTCIRVESEDQPLFEDVILKPYFDMTVDELFGDEDQGQGYWWLTANPKIWSFTDIKIGEEQSYTLYNENGNKRRIFQNFQNVKAGDAVIGYEANPVKKVVAVARITQASDGKAIYFEKVEGLAAPIEYLTLKECPELEKMEFFVQPNGSLFKLTKGEYDFIMDIIREENPLPKQDTIKQKYTKEDFLSKVYMTEERYRVVSETQ